MSRKEELTNYLKGKTDMVLVENYIDELISLEKALLQLRDEEPILVHPNDPTKKKPNPVYKEKISLLAQYNSCIRTVAHLTGANEVEEDSPLRAWVKENVSKE